MRAMKWAGPSSFTWMSIIVWWRRLIMIESVHFRLFFAYLSLQKAKNFYSHRHARDTECFYGIWTKAGSVSAHFWTCCSASVWKPVNIMKPSENINSDSFVLSVEDLVDLEFEDHAVTGAPGVLHKGSLSIWTPIATRTRSRLKHPNIPFSYFAFNTVPVFMKSTLSRAREQFRTTHSLTEWAREQFCTISK